VDAPDYAALPRLTISLQVADTPDRFCTSFVDGWPYTRFVAKMGAVVPGFSLYGTGTSVAVLPATYEEWFQEVGYGTRRKVRRAEKLGYTFQEIDRDEYLDDMYEINHSLGQRQGREMGEAYQKRWGPFGPLPEQGCPRHRLLTYGVLKDGKLVAYSWTNHTGEMFLLTTLLGHGDHLADGIMYFLIAGVVKDRIENAGARYAVYERHWSGTEGLRFWKEQMGFRPYLVTWLRGDEKPPTRKDLVVAALAPRLAKTKKGKDRVVRGLKRRVKPVRARLGRLKRAVKRRVSAGGPG